MSSLRPRSSDTATRCSNATQVKCKVQADNVQPKPRHARAQALPRRHVSMVLPIVLQAIFTQGPARAEALSTADVKKRLVQCFEDQQYYVSGKLDFPIFAEDCLFTDPTTRVKGREKYAAAVASIFSPETARADMISCSIVAPNEIDLRWRLAGSIRQAGRDFNFKPYTGSTRYILDSSSGQIVKQMETWDINILDVFVSLFNPSFGAPPAPPIEQLRQQESL